jgi:hypothetical protein
VLCAATLSPPPSRAVVRDRRQSGLIVHPAYDATDHQLAGRDGPGTRDLTSGCPLCGRFPVGFVDGRPSIIHRGQCPIELGIWTQRTRDLVAFFEDDTLTEFARPCCDAEIHDAQICGETLSVGAAMLVSRNNGSVEWHRE